MMNFYFKNNDQDKIFLEVINKYNLAYWVASDIDNYVENKDNIGGYEYNKLITQFKSAFDLYIDAHKKSNFLNGDHKKSSEALKNFVGNCIESFDFFSKEKYLDSELRDIELISQVGFENKFHEEFVPFINVNHFELQLIKSYSFLNQIAEDMLYLDIDIHLEKNIAIVRSIEEAFTLAKETIDYALVNENCFDGIIDDFKIINNKKDFSFSNKDFISMKEKNIDFMKLWREYYYLNEQLFKNFFDEDTSFEEVELKVIQKETKDYLSMINIVGIDICETTLTLQGLDIPSFKVYSKELISKPLNTIKVN